MGSSSDGGDYTPPDIPAPSGQVTPTPQQSPPPTWARYPSFLPSNPSAMAGGLTPQMANAIDAYSNPAYMTPGQVAGFDPTKITQPSTAAAPAAEEAAAGPTSRLITHDDIENMKRAGGPYGGIVGQANALVGQPFNDQNRGILAAMMRRGR